MKACLITTKQLDIDLTKYDLVIGIEYGGIYLNNLDIDNKHFVSDFDSIPTDSKNKIIDTEENVLLLKSEKIYSDTEEAIIYALNHNYNPDEIDVFVNEDLNRKDHLMNVFFIANKYQVTVFGNSFILRPVKKDVDTIIYKDNYKFLSIYVFSETILSSVGLKYEITNDTYDINTGTILISNEITATKTTITSNKNILIMQSKD